MPYFRSLLVSVRHGSCSVCKSVNPVKGVTYMCATVSACFALFCDVSIWARLLQDVVFFCDSRAPFKSSQ